MALTKNVKGMWVKSTPASWWRRRISACTAFFGMIFTLHNGLLLVIWCVRHIGCAAGQQTEHQRQEQSGERLLHLAHSLHIRLKQGKKELWEGVKMQ
jgi:hypothetical protein